MPLNKKQRQLFEELVNSGLLNQPKSKTQPVTKAIKPVPKPRNNTGLVKAIQNNSRMSQSAKTKALASIEAKRPAPIKIKKPRVKKNDVIEIADDE